jgi:positive regulator of sigma E activity
MILGTSELISIFLPIILVLLSYLIINSWVKRITKARKEQTELLKQIVKLLENKNKI